MLADTVGFIRELPHELVAAFRATLTEAREADLLLHVVDAAIRGATSSIAGRSTRCCARSAPQRHSADPGLQQDRPPRRCAPRIDRDADGRVTAVWISAAAGAGLDLLRQAVAERLARFARRARLRMPAAAGALRSRLYAAQAVRSETSGDDGSLELAVELPDLELLQLARTAGVQILEVQGPDAPCSAPDAYLQSSARASAAKLR